MKVRVKQHPSNVWVVEVWRWYWPLWVKVDAAHNFDAAMAVADRIKNPTIVEVR